MLLSLLEVSSNFDGERILIIRSAFNTYLGKNTMTFFLDTISILYM